MASSIATRVEGGVRAPLVRIVVPWRSDGGRRAQLWSFARARLERQFPTFEIVEGASPPGPFNRSAAINDGARGDWDAVVVVDSDVFIESEQVVAAIERALSTGRLTLAFDEYRGLTPHMTAQVLAGNMDAHLNRGVRFRTRRHESSVVVVPRRLWERVGGFDELFIGWGQEDVAFVQSCRVIGGGIERVEGPVWHLWHERSPERRPSDQYRANQERGQRYREATSVEEIDELINEKERAWSTERPRSRASTG